VANRKSSRTVIGARLLHAVDDYLRKKQRGRGDMSNLIREAVEAVDLASVELISIHGKKHTVTAKATQVVIPTEMRRQLERWSEKRNCTMNELLNSALMVALLKARSGRGGGRGAMAALGKMTAKEREEFFGTLLALTGLEPGPDHRSRDGSYYEYDPQLEATVEVAKDGRRFVVDTVAGGELVRVREVGQAPFMERGKSNGARQTRARRRGERDPRQGT
jgi:hypothetical protein